jgi:hypothetical protein
MKSSVQWCLVLSTYIALGLLGFMLYPSVVHTPILFSCIYVCAVLDSIVFFICCGILRKLEVLTFWKFMVYLVMIVVPSTVVSSITSDLSHNFFIARDNFFVLWPNIRPDPQLFLLFCAFILLASLNFVLWRALFNTTLRQAILVGFLLGFFNMIACLVATPIVKCF